MSLDKVRAAPGVVAVLTVDDIPGVNDCGPIIHDDPIPAKDVVQFIGQPIFVVVASSHDAARRAARLAEIDYEDLPPVLSPEAAHAAGSYVLPPMHLTRGEPRAHIDGATHRDAGKIQLGGQEQFYLEGQIAYAAPRENDGMHVWCSTQHPDRDAARRGAYAQLARAPGAGGAPAHGRRLRRQGIAIGHVRLLRRAGGLEAAVPGEAAPGPRRRHDDHRQAP